MARYLGLARISYGHFGSIQQELKGTDGWVVLKLKIYSNMGKGGVLYDLDKGREGTLVPLRSTFSVVRLLKALWTTGGSKLIAGALG